AVPGQRVLLPLRVARTTELTGSVKVEAVLPAAMKGVTATAVTVSEGDEAAVLTLELAPDADLAGHDHILFRATAERDGYPVIAETAVEIESAAGISESRRTTR